MPGKALTREREPLVFPGLVTVDVFVRVLRQAPPPSVECVREVVLAGVLSGYTGMTFESKPGRAEAIVRDTMRESIKVWVYPCVLCPQMYEL